METRERGGPDSRLALSIVIPLYRDADALEAIFTRCRPVLDAADGDAELVLVDDGGLDDTTQRAKDIASDYPHPTTIVTLARNFGQHPAVFAGLAHARGRRVVTLDSDLQYPPEEIPKLLGELSDEFPVVSGFRADRQDPVVRRAITHALTRWLNSRTGSHLRDFGSMFRAYDRRTVELMLQFTERHRYVPAVVAWLGVPIKEIPIIHSPRSAQGSRYRLSALIDMVLDLITGYSVFPLRILTFLGVLASLVGFIGTLIFVVYRIAVGAGVSGTVSAFALVFALSGMQLLILALTNEYVGRIYTEAKARPYYVVGRVQQIAARAAPPSPISKDAD